MEVTVIVPSYLCLANFPKPTILGDAGRRIRFLKAHTAADAIAQAELLLREFPGATLLEVQPFEEHLAHLINGPTARIW